MQPDYGLRPETMRAIFQTLSPARMGRYLIAAEGHAELALRLYIWNARLCESFYLPCQMAEVACRNTLARALADRYGGQWYECAKLRTSLPDRLRDELHRAVVQERARHGAGLTVDHIIGSLTFGFWVHLMTKGFEFLLWKNGVRRYFPQAPAAMTRTEMHKRVDQVRIFRNRIAHHDAVFDKRPTAEHNNMFLVVGWICLDTQWLLGRVTAVPRVINTRPRLAA